MTIVAPSPWPETGLERDANNASEQVQFSTQRSSFGNYSARAIRRSAKYFRAAKNEGGNMLLGWLKAWHVALYRTLRKRRKRASPQHPTATNRRGRMREAGE